MVFLSKFHSNGLLAFLQMRMGSAEILNYPRKCKDELHRSNLFVERTIMSRHELHRSGLLAVLLMLIDNVRILN